MSAEGGRPLDRAALPAADVARIIEAVAAVLDSRHDAGEVRGTLTPAAIVVRRDEKGRVTDAGLTDPATHERAWLYAAPEVPISTRWAPSPGSCSPGVRRSPPPTRPASGSRTRRPRCRASAACVPNSPVLTRYSAGRCPRAGPAGSAPVRSSRRRCGRAWNRWTLMVMSPVLKFPVQMVPPRPSARRPAAKQSRHPGTHRLFPASGRSPSRSRPLAGITLTIRPRQGVPKRRRQSRPRTPRPHRPECRHPERRRPRSRSGPCPTGGPPVAGLP